MGGNDLTMTQKEHRAFIYAVMVAVLLVIGATVLRGQTPPQQPTKPTPPAASNKAVAPLSRPEEPAAPKENTLPLTPVGTLKVNGLRLRIQLLQNDINLVAQEERVAHGVGNDWGIDLQRGLLVQQPPEAPKPATPKTK